MTWIIFTVLLSGFWCAQADMFPVAKEFRPAYFEYGWPLCWGKASRDWLRFIAISPLAIVVDCIVSVAVLTFAHFAITRLVMQRLHFDLWGIVVALPVGVSLLCCLLSCDARFSNTYVPVGHYRTFSRLGSYQSLLIGLAILLAACEIVYRLKPQTWNVASKNGRQEEKIEPNAKGGNRSDSAEREKR